MEKNNTVYLELIVGAIEKVGSYLDGFSFVDFEKDSKTQSAVLMQFQIIGELAKKVSLEVKNTIHLPWKQIAGFRDTISHDYFSIDLESVWKTVEENLPEVKKRIQEYIK